MSKKIVLTGGGTAGHVMLHLAILNDLIENNWIPVYIGSDGIEKKLMEPTKIEFKTILAGKLRRYFSFENLLDVFKVVLGTVQSFFLLLMIRPNVVFTKGGFVSVPVAIAAWLLRIPVVTHESDVTPGLANKIISRFSKKLLYSFPETEKFLPKNKSVYVGAVVRKELFEGKRELGYALTNFSPEDPRKTILVMGGSQGSVLINTAIEENATNIAEKFKIIHLTGKDKKTSVPNSLSYKQFEFVSEELKHLLSISDFVVSRAGANSIFELLALNKPMLLIPLEAGSRGDQIVNAKSFVNNGWAISLSEKDINPQSFLQAIRDLNQHHLQIIASQTQIPKFDSSAKVLQILEDMI